MTHLEKLLEGEIEHRNDTPLLYSVVKECGYYASILFCYLFEKQIEQVGIGDRYNLRQGRKWIPMLDESEIWLDLPIFPDVRTICRAAEELEVAGYITTERTGAFLDRDKYLTGRARDEWPWWRVCKEPVDYSKRTRICALEAAAFGMTSALILSHWEKCKLGIMEGSKEYKRLSAVELEKVLPMDEKTVRRQLKALVEVGALERHPKRPKLYRLTGMEITADLVKPKRRISVVSEPQAKKGREVSVPEAFKPLMLDFHSGNSVVESSAMERPAFLDWHAA